MQRPDQAIDPPLLDSEDVLLADCSAAGTSTRLGSASASQRAYTQTADSPVLEPTVELPLQAATIDVSNAAIYGTSGRINKGKPAALPPGAPLRLQPPRPAPALPLSPPACRTTLRQQCRYMDQRIPHTISSKTTFSRTPPQSKKSNSRLGRWTGTNLVVFDVESAPDLLFRLLMG
eukprot:2672206-Rhodomonas_salina.1